MSDIIRKTHNSYSVVHGYIMSWERAEEAHEGHRVTILDQDEQKTTFRWRMRLDPVAGEKVSLVMVESGASLRPDHPVVILNHDNGAIFREPNAPEPRGTRPILSALAVWILGALIVSAGLLYFAEAMTRNVILLVSAAFMIWRIAISTSELRSDERAMTRLRDEDSMCLELITGAWRLAAGEVFELKRKKEVADHAGENAG